MEQQFERERLSLVEQKNHLRQQLDSLREELAAKLEQANQEVSQEPPNLSHLSSCSSHFVGAICCGRPDKQSLLLSTAGDKKMSRLI
jgi:hypothetical protein